MCASFIVSAVHGVLTVPVSVLNVCKQGLFICIEISTCHEVQGTHSYYSCRDVIKIVYKPKVNVKFVLAATSTLTHAAGLL